MKNWMIVSMRFCIAVLAVAFCLQCKAQSSTTKRLTSFCGFKAGEKRQNIKVSKGNPIYPETVQCRSPFRKFRDARLRFSDDDRLVGVDAVTFIQGMKPSVGKTELDKCCSDLAKYGIVFPDEWRDQGDGHIDKEGSGPGVSFIHIQGDLQASRYDEKSGNEKKGVLLTIDLSWGDIDVVTASSKDKKYTGKSNLTRREFIENTFGVKFGEEIPAGVRKNSKYNDDRLVTIQLAQPVCSIGYVTFACDKDKKLSSISLDKRISARSMKGTEPEYGKLCREIKTWLGIDSLETKDTDVSFRLNGETVSVLRRVSSFEDGNIRAEVDVMDPEGSAKLGEKGASLSITIRLPMENQQKRSNRAIRGNAAPTER